MLHTSSITFSTRFAVYKKQGVHRYVLQIYYFINRVFKSFCSSVGIIIDGLALP
jgi:hypothetical protein